jgi:hypothetical protein
MNLLIPCFFDISFITFCKSVFGSTDSPSYCLYRGYRFGGDVNIYDILLLDIDLPNLVALLFFNPDVLRFDRPKLFYFDKDSIDNFQKYI